MVKKKILVSTVALITVVLLFLLPKVVVNNDEDNIATEQNDATDAARDAPVSSADPNTAHDIEISPEQKKEIARLKESYKNSEKSVNFADSLITAFIGVGQYDSAAAYAESIVAQDKDVKNLLKAANLYYEAYMFAVDNEKQQTFGAKARSYYEKVLAAEPKNYDAKVKLAMTYMSTQNPMKGISMLREVVAEDENNELAIFNLGVLSLQSGQYEKATERFEKLVQINPNHLQGNFYLGVGYFELGKKNKAKEQFELVKKMDNDPELAATIDNYLNRI